jgi:predicted aspartyl protease
MRRIPCGVAVIVLFVAGHGVSLELGDPVDRSNVAVSAFSERGGIIVPVTIGGAGPFRFILDTGSSRTAIADELAAEVASRIVARTEVVSSAGAEIHAVTQLERVEVAGARAAVLLASVVPAARLRTIGSGIRGILGQDFLSDLNYTLDYRRGRLTWDGENTVSCQSRSALPLISAEGRYVVLVAQERSARSLRLVPDTGSDSLVLFAPRGTLDPASTRDAMAVTALTGTTRARTGRGPTLIVGDVPLQNAAAVMVERDDDGADGLLPLHVFGSVSFNMRDAA